MGGGGDNNNSNNMTSRELQFLQVNRQKFCFVCLSFIADFLLLFF